MQTLTTQLLNTGANANANAKAKAGFLRPFDELILLGIPTIGLFLTIIVNAFSQFGYPTFGRSDVASFLITLIFLDGVHVTFTFMLLACLPELRRWSTSKRNVGTENWSKGKGFWKRMVYIATALALLIYILKVAPTAAIPGMATIWLFLELLGPSQHTAAQMRGISFVYNSTIRKAYQFTDAEKKQAADAEKWERILFKGLILGDVLYFIPFIFLEDKFVIPGIHYVKMVGGAILGGSAVGLLLNSFRYPKQSETDKTLFLTRVLLFPFKMINPVGGLALRATHGTEYLVIFKRIIQSSSISDTKKKRAYLLTFLVSAVYGIFFVSLWPGPMGKLFHLVPSRNLAAIAIIFTFVVRYTHYYMDAVIFKMSDPLTRETVSPLLVPAKK